MAKEESKLQGEEREPGLLEEEEGARCAVCGEALIDGYYLACHLCGERACYRHVGYHHHGIHREFAQKPIEKEVKSIANIR